MTARSYLYVPGTRPDMLAKACDRGADAVVADLEDGVAAQKKDDARNNVAEWLSSNPAGTSQLWVRINAEPELMGADLAVLHEFKSVTGVFYPKAMPESLEALAERLPSHLHIVPLIETAEGVVRLADIARVPGVARLGIGEADLIAQLGMDPSSDRAELMPIRVQVVVASAGAGLEQPVGPVSTDLGDLDQLEASTEALRRMGFGARTAIHPAQLPVINRVFTPSRAEAERARRLLEEAAQAMSAGSAVHVDADGNMVDEAVLRGARRIAALADQYGVR